MEICAQWLRPSDALSGALLRLFIRVGIAQGSLGVLFVLFLDFIVAEIKVVAHGVHGDVVNVLHHGTQADQRAANDDAHNDPEGAPPGSGQFQAKVYEQPGEGRDQYAHHNQQDGEGIALSGGFRQYRLESHGCAQCNET